MIEGAWELKTYMNDVSYWDDSTQTTLIQQETTERDIDPKQIVWLFRNGKIYHYSRMENEDGYYWVNLQDANRSYTVTIYNETLIFITETADYNTTSRTEPPAEKVITRYHVGVTKDSMVLDSSRSQRIYLEESPAVQVITEAFVFVRENTLEDSSASKGGNTTDPNAVPARI